MDPPSSAENVSDRAERAGAAPRHQLGQYFMETQKEVLVAFARNPNLQEPDLLRLLERKDLAPEVVRQIAGHKEALRSYPVKFALARHPRTPRLITLPMLKFLHLFDLVRVAQTPAVPTDVKLAVEETILKKAERIPRGEKITLARRGSGRVAAGLLLTEDEELIQAVLDNPFLTEAQVIRILSLERLPATRYRHGLATRSMVAAILPAAGAGAKPADPIAPSPEIPARPGRERSSRRLPRPPHASAPAKIHPSVLRRQTERAPGGPAMIVARARHLLHLCAQIGRLPPRTLR